MDAAQRRFQEGSARLSKRDFSGAADCLVAAARLAPGKAPIWLALGIARRELGQWEPAREALTRALTLDPALPQASAQLGLVLQALGRLDDAVEALAAEARRFPTVPRNHNNLGMALAAAGRDIEARDAFLRAVELDSDYRHAHGNLADLFQRRGEYGAAIYALRQVIRLSPGDAALHLRLGRLLVSSWKLSEAESALREAVALAPDRPEHACTLAYVLRGLNRLDEARAIARAVLAGHPHILEAAVLDKLGLPIIYESGEALRAAREGYRRGLAELVADAGRFAGREQQVLGLDWENFHLAYQGGDDRALQQAYADFIAGLGRVAAPRYYEPRARRLRVPGDRLKVGFLSSFLRDCTVGKYFASWMTDLDDSRFEVIVYATGHVHDTLSAVIEARAAGFRRALGTIPQVADAVLADGLDVLVYPDVGMHTASYVLAGMRLAPVQCAGWGHPVTTGQEAIDYFITCGEMEPEAAESHYRESLVRLPGIGTRYARPGRPSVKSRAELGLPAEGHLYLCPQSLFKIHPDNDALFASVLAEDAEGLLVFFRDHDEPLTGIYQRRLFAALGARGVDGGARTVFLGRMAHADFLSVNAQCDAMLDTLHWSGGNTSLDAIAAGLPVVTLPGRFMRGRQSAAMLRRMGLDELVAKDERDFVRIAIRVATDLEWCAQVRARMAAGAAKIFDDRAPAAALAAFLESVASPAPGG